MKIETKYELLQTVFIINYGSIEQLLIKEVVITPRNLPFQGVVNICYRLSNDECFGECEVFETPDEAAESMLERFQRDQAGKEQAA